MGDPREREKELVKRATEMNFEFNADYEQEHFAKLILSLHQDRVKREKSQ